MGDLGDFVCGSGIPAYCQYPAADAYHTADFVFSKYYELYRYRGETCDFSGNAEFLPSDQWVDSRCVSAPFSSDILAPMISPSTPSDGVLV